MYYTFIVPDNDLEAVTIAKLVRSNGHRCLVTKASTAKDLEKDIYETIMDDALYIDVMKKKYSDEYSPYGNGKKFIGWESIQHIKSKDFEKGEMYVERTYKDFSEFVFVEIEGVMNGATAIFDNYSDKVNGKSSLERVAELINAPLTERMMFIAANDKSGIHGMKKLAVKFRMTDKEEKDIIDSIRMGDRISHGVTFAQEEEARYAVANKVTTNNITYVELDHNETSPVLDMMYGTYKNLIIKSTNDNEINFYGWQSVCDGLYEKFKGWEGTNGYWGMKYKDEDQYNEIYRTICELTTQ